MLLAQTRSDTMGNSHHAHINPAQTQVLRHHPRARLVDLHSWIAFCSVILMFFCTVDNINFCR